MVDRGRRWRGRGVARGEVGEGGVDGGGKGGAALGGGEGGEAVAQSARDGEGLRLPGQGRPPNGRDGEEGGVGGGEEVAYERVFHRAEAVAEEGVVLGGVAGGGAKRGEAVRFKAEGVRAVRIRHPFSPLLPSSSSPPAVRRGGGGGKPVDQVSNVEEYTQGVRRGGEPLGGVSVPLVGRRHFGEEDSRVLRAQRKAVRVEGGLSRHGGEAAKSLRVASEVLRHSHLLCIPLLPPFLCTYGGRESERGDGRNEGRGSAPP